MTSFEGSFAFITNNMIKVRRRPAMLRRKAAKRNGGMSITPIRMPRNVVPQRTHTTASAVYASQEFLDDTFRFMMQNCSLYEYPVGDSLVISLQIFRF